MGVPIQIWGGGQGSVPVVVTVFGLLSVCSVIYKVGSGPVEFRVPWGPGPVGFRVS